MAAQAASFQNALATGLGAITSAHVLADLSCPSENNGSWSFVHVDSVCRVPLSHPCRTRKAQSIHARIACCGVLRRAAACFKSLMLITHLCLCFSKSSPRASGQYQQFCAEIGRIEERMRALVSEAPPLLPSSPPRAPCKDTSMAGGPSRLSAVRTRKSSGCASRKSVREHALPFGPAHDSILSSFMPTCRYRALSAECARTRVTRYPTDHASDISRWLHAM